MSDYINKIKKGQTSYDVQDARVPSFTSSDAGKAFKVNASGELELVAFPSTEVWGNTQLSVEDFYDQLLTTIAPLYMVGKLKLMFLDGTTGKGYDLLIVPTFSGGDLSSFNFYYFDENGTHQEMTDESVGYVIVYGNGIEEEE